MFQSVCEYIGNYRNAKKTLRKKKKEECSLNPVTGRLTAIALTRNGNNAVRPRRDRNPCETLAIAGGHARVRKSGGAAASERLFYGATIRPTKTWSLHNPEAVAHTYASRDLPFHPVLCVQLRALCLFLPLFYHRSPGSFAPRALFAPSPPRAAPLSGAHFLVSWRGARSIIEFFASGREFLRLRVTVTRSDTCSDMRERLRLSPLQTRCFWEPQRKSGSIET